MSAPLQMSFEGTLTDELHCHHADFTLNHDDSGIIVTARGELDAANAAPFAAYVIQRAVLQPTATGNHVTVDLDALDFFGIEGFSVLHTINVRCAAQGVQWTLTVGPAVSRVLRICDPVGALPVRVPEVAPRGPASLQLISQLAQGPGQEPRHVHL